MFCDVFDAFGRLGRFWDVLDIWVFCTPRDIFECLWDYFGCVGMFWDVLGHFGSFLDFFCMFLVILDILGTFWAIL